MWWHIEKKGKKWEVNTIKKCGAGEGERKEAAESSSRYNGSHLSPWQPSKCSARGNTELRHPECSKRTAPARLPACTCRAKRAFTRRGFCSCVHTETRQHIPGLQTEQAEPSKAESKHILLLLHNPTSSHLFVRTEMLQDKRAHEWDMTRSHDAGIRGYRCVVPATHTRKTHDPCSQLWSWPIGWRLPSISHDSWLSKLLWNSSKPVSCGELVCH